MRARLGVFAVAALVGLVPGAGKGLDSPHDKEDATTTACYHCHTLTVPTESGAYDFSQACTSCHNREATGFGLPWSVTDGAVPGTTGSQHNWSGPAVNPAHGAGTQYLVIDVADKLVDGKLQCAVCHDAHGNNVALDPQSMHASIAPGVTPEKTGTFNAVTTGSATLELKTTVGASARGYRLRVTSVGGGGGAFIMSHDFGWNPDRWLNWNGSAWVPGTVDGPARAFTNGTYIALDDPKVEVRWTSGALVGDYWDFYIGYPMLRLSNVQDAACTTCHRERMMNHVRARGDDRYYRPNGVRKFSHPVGVALNANGFGMDRAVILDADGTSGSSTTDGQGGVANPTNDLELKGGAVRCTTCHAPHNADSNSLSVDAR